MAGEATKKQGEYGDPNNPGRGQAPEVQQEDPSKQDPNKRNKPDQYNQGGGMPPTEQASGKQGGQGTQTGHEDPRSGSGQHSGQNQPQGGQQQVNQTSQGGNQGGQQGQKSNPQQQQQQQQQGGQRQGQNEGTNRDRENKSNTETDDRGVKQGQQKH